MKVKKFITLVLTCICAASSAVYAGNVSNSTVVITDAEEPQAESSDLDGNDILTDESVETSAVNPALETSDAESKADDPLGETPVSESPVSETPVSEETVGAVTYRSVFEPCFAEALYLNRDATYGNRNDYTLLDIDFDGFKELIVNVVHNKHGRVYYIFKINPKTLKASLLGKAWNDSFEPVATNGSRIAFIESYKGRIWFKSSPFTGNDNDQYTRTLYEGSHTYSSVLAAMKDLTRKKFAANAVLSPAFIDISDLSLLNSAGTVTYFSDVIPNTTAHAKEVYWALAKGITKGYSGTNRFGINDTCTRGEAAMFLWRLAGKPSPKSVSKSPFSDVPKSHAFYNAILWTYQKGIAKGYSNGTFGINGKCTRGQIATFIWRYKGSPKPKTTKSSFKDAITPAFKNAVLWAAEAGITKGYPDGTFRDTQNCTRGEIVTFLYRIK